MPYLKIPPGILSFSKIVTAYPFFKSSIAHSEEQCEGSCIRGIKQTPTKIGELEKFINEWADENKIEYKINQKEKNGKKVAIIGSGPAGIECAILIFIIRFQKNIGFIYAF